jgi:hypothetical protein
MTPLNPPFEGGKFSPPPLEGELEGVNLDLLIIISTQLEKGELTRRALNLLTTLSREEVSGAIRFLEDYR